MPAVWRLSSPKTRWRASIVCHPLPRRLVTRSLAARSFHVGTGPGFCSRDAFFLFSRPSSGRLSSPRGPRADLRWCARGLRVWRGSRTAQHPPWPANSVKARRAAGRAEEGTNGAWTAVLAASLRPSPFAAWDGFWDGCWHVGNLRVDEGSGDMRGDTTSRTTMEPASAECTPAAPACATRKFLSRRAAFGAGIGSVVVEMKLWLDRERVTRQTRPRNACTCLKAREFRRRRAKSTQPKLETQQGRG